jgi:putative peptide zinc metalloprotease protein
MSRQVFSPSWHNVAELRPRLLPHARFHRHVYRGQLWHIVHDTTSGKYHRMSPGAYALARRMDGRHTVQQLWDYACKTAGEEIPTQNEVVDLLSQLHANDLLHCDVTPDAAQLLERHRKHRFAQWKQRLGNPLGMRIPLVHPDRFLTRHAGKIRWLFSVPGALLWLLVVLPAAVLAAVHFNELTGNLSDRLLSQQNLLLLSLLFVPVKILHELGHGMATKRWGGDVPEMGVMFLVFAPVPYVDSSSAAAFRDKYRRAIVGAAGMMVELFLAALAMYLWLLVEPGPLRAVAFNVMVIAGISTLVVNGNPLLRFDGYYILADLVEIPNLAQRGQKYCTWLLDRYGFGARELERPTETPGEKLWLVPYTVASWLYRMLITSSIILFIAGKFFIFGALVGLWGAIQFLLLPIYKAIKHVNWSPTLQRHRNRAIRLSLGLAAVVVIAITAVPMPLRTQAEGVVWLPDSALLRARTDGTFERWLVQPGQRVTSGTPLLIMSDPALTAELEVARAKTAEYQARYDAEQFADPVAAEVTLPKLEQQRRELAHAEERYSRLIVTSTTGGVLVAPDYRDLPGQHLRKGALLGYLMDREKLIARVAVVQDDIDLVRTQLRAARLRLAETLAENHAVTVLREVPGAVDELPTKALSPAGGGNIPTDPQDPNGLRVLNRVFLFDLSLPANASPDTFGSHVYVRFEHVSEPLVAQWHRRLRQLFLSRFDV